MTDQNAQLSLEQELIQFQNIVNKKHNINSFSKELTNFLLKVMNAQMGAVYLKVTESLNLKEIYCTSDEPLNPMPNTLVGEIVFFEDQLLIPLAYEQESIGAVILKGADQKLIVKNHFELIQIGLITSLKFSTMIKDQYLNRKMRVINEHLLSYQTDTEGRIIEVSEALAKQLELNKEEVVGESAQQIFSEQQTEAFDDQVYKLTTKSGEDIWLKSNAFTTFNFLGEKEGEIHLQQNITDLKRVEKMSITDDLTGLYNRRFFNELFPREVNNALRNHNIVAFILIDIDNFKKGADPDNS